MGRGALTDGVKVLSKELMGYEITVTELRLMPYVQYCLLDDENLKLRHISVKDDGILADWIEKDYIKHPFGSFEGEKFSVSPEFYDIMCKILKLGYVIACGRISDWPPA